MGTYAADRSMSRNRAVDSDTRKYIRNKNYNRCSRCGVSHPTLQIHHIKAISDGGTSEHSNLDTLCHECHVEWHGMGTQHYEYAEWLQTVRHTYPLATLLYAFKHYGPGPLSDVLRRYATRPYSRMD